ncbi:MAG TPA: VWA domain-containing protein [Terriglobales bacterium]|nr:VWA domain-containing protein [Terriglobales bacterium]
MRWSLAAGIAAALAPGAAAQAKPQAPIVFHASTRLVQINVIVDGHHGPQTGLAADDFSIFDNGHRQPIRVFEVNAPPASGPAAAAAASTGAGGSFSNGAPRARNMVVVLFDALDTADGTEYFAGQPTWMSRQAFAFAREHALRFLGSVKPDERVALYGLDSHLRVLCDFTSDRARLLAALRSYNPVTGAGGDSRGLAMTEVPGGSFDAQNAAAAGVYATEVVGANRARATVAALRQISANLAGLPGRISLVWILSRPILSGAIVEAALGRDNIAVYTVDARGLLAREAPVPVSGSDSPDLGLSFAASVARLETQPSGLSRMQDIARETGGRAYINTNGIAGAIASAAADSAYSYTLGFYVGAHALDNRFHRLTVRVRGHGLHARYPHGYWALAQRDAAGLGAALDAAIRSPLDASAIGLQAHLEDAGTVPAPQLRLLGALNIRGLQMPEQRGMRRGAVLLEAISQDATGAVVQRRVLRLKLDLNLAAYTLMLHSGLRFDEAIEPVPGAVTLRLLAEDTTSGAVGSLIMPLPGAH